MKKQLLIILVLLFIVGCRDNGINVNNELIEEDTTEEDAKKDVQIWDIEPMYEFEDIDTWVTTRKYLSYGPCASGADTGINSGTLEGYCVSYNREDFYNSNNQYYFVIESLEKGGAMIKNGGYGLINKDGIIKLEPKYIFATTEASGLVFNYGIGRMNRDYSIDLPDLFKDMPFDLVYAGGSSSLSALTFDGKSVYQVDEETNTNMWEENPKLNFIKYDLYEKAVSRGYINKGDNILINTYASYHDFNHYYDNYLNYFNNKLTGYILLNEDNYVIINAPSNYVVADYSNGVIMFANCLTNIDDVYNGRDFCSSCNYYSYELCCDNYDYSGYVYITDDNKNIGEYEDGYGFYEGYAPVKKNGKWGYIDKQGNIVVDFIFDKATIVSDGKTWVKHKGKIGKLNIIDLLNNNITITDELLG